MFQKGAILVEMHTGVPIFDGKDEQEQLIKMAAVLNSMPQRLIEQSPKRKSFFQWDAKQRRWVLAPPGKDVTRYAKTSLEDILGAYSGGPGGRRLGQPGHSQADYLCFIDFVRKMFTYDAESRLKPSDALHHAFLIPLLNDMNQPSCPSSKPYFTQPLEVGNYASLNKGEMDEDIVTDSRTLTLPAQQTKPNKLISPPSAAPKRLIYNSSSTLRGYRPQDAHCEQQPPLPKTRSSSKAIQPSTQSTGHYGKSVIRSRSSVVVSSAHGSSTSNSLKGTTPKMAMQTQVFTRQSRGGEAVSNAIPLSSPMRLKPKTPATTSQVESIEPAVTPTLHLLSADAYGNKPSATTSQNFYKSYSSSSPAVPSPSFDSFNSGTGTRKAYQLRNATEVTKLADATTPSSTYMTRASRTENGISGSTLVKKAASTSMRVAAGGNDVSSWDLSSYHGGAEPPLKVSC
jgi:serine/threonine protein kinase